MNPLRARDGREKLWVQIFQSIDTCVFKYLENGFRTVSRRRSFLDLNAGLNNLNECIPLITIET